MRKREIWKVIIFGLITLGIYDLVWLYKTRNEMVAKGAKIPSFGWLLLPLLFLLVMTTLYVIAGFILIDLPGNGTTPGILNAIFILLTMLSILAFIPVWLYWTYTYCKALEKITKGKLALGLNYVMMLALNIIGLGILWPPIVQDTFNKTR